MATLGAVYLVLKVIAALLSIILSGRKLYRWIKEARNKRKPTA